MVVDPVDGAYRGEQRAPLGAGLHRGHQGHGGTGKSGADAAAAAAARWTAGRRPDVRLRRAPGGMDDETGVDPGGGAAARRRELDA
eukprot:3792750-Pleurochrysis_carterae.AAC.1